MIIHSQSVNSTTAAELYFFSSPSPTTAAAVKKQRVACTGGLMAQAKLKKIQSRSLTRRCTGGISDDILKSAVGLETFRPGGG